MISLRLLLLLSTYYCKQCYAFHLIQPKTMVEKCRHDFHSSKIATEKSNGRYSDVRSNHESDGYSMDVLQASNSSNIIHLKTNQSYSLSYRFQVTTTRRYALSSTITRIVSTIVFGNAFPTTVQKCFAIGNSESNVDCLLDLPPIDTTKFIRLLLCRHGETEYNRLKLMQGARVNSSINDTGKQQAMSLGQALASYHHQQQQVSTKAREPFVIFHSPLLRAQQTATIATTQFPQATNKQRPIITMLPSLMEIDFGSDWDDEPVEKMKAKRYATYAAWSMGELDVRMSDDGESGWEVLERIVSAVKTIVEIASTTKSGIVAAVTHSVFIRMLLASIEPSSLMQISKIGQTNCCINVIDFPKVQLPPPLLPLPVDTTAAAASTTENGETILKMGNIIRINENRHIRTNG